MRSDDDLRQIGDRLVAADLMTLPEAEAATVFRAIAGHLTTEELQRMAMLSVLSAERSGAKARVEVEVPAGDLLDWVRKSFAPDRAARIEQWVRTPGVTPEATLFRLVTYLPGHINAVSDVFTDLEPHDSDREAAVAGITVWANALTLDEIDRL